MLNFKAEGLRNDYFIKANHTNYASRPVWDYPENAEVAPVAIKLDAKKALEHFVDENRMDAGLLRLGKQIGALGNAPDELLASTTLEDLVNGHSVEIAPNELSTVIAVCEDNHILAITDALKHIYREQVLDKLYAVEPVKPKSSSEVIDELFDQFKDGDITLNQLKAKCKKLVER